MEEIGLFPLGIVLLPTERVPLHIFEPRYRELIGECMEDESEFGLVYADEDGVREVGTRARVTEVLELFDDGRLNIVIEGGERFRIEKLTRGRSFMTACCAVIGGDGRLSFAGAGHPPLLVRRREGVIEALPSLGGLIGINPAVEIGETVTTLASGDVALLYTDGLYSLKSTGGARLSRNTLTEVFAQIGESADFFPQLIAQLVQRSSAQVFDDDLAAIALRRA